MVLLADCEKLLEEDQVILLGISAQAHIVDVRLQFRCLS